MHKVYKDLEWIGELRYIGEPQIVTAEDGLVAENPCSVRTRLDLVRLDESGRDRHEKYGAWFHGVVPKEFEGRVVTLIESLHFRDNMDHGVRVYKQRLTSHGLEPVVAKAAYYR